MNDEKLTYAQAAKIAGNKTMERLDNSACFDGNDFVELEGGFTWVMTYCLTGMFTIVSHAFVETEILLSADLEPDLKPTYYTIEPVFVSATLH